jgi:type II secretory pathway component PulF
MATYSYIARTKSGERTEGSLDANDRRSALAIVEQMGHVPVSIKEVGAGASEDTTRKRSRFSFERRRPPRMNSRDVLTFSTEMSDLLASGMTLGNALNILANNKTGRASDQILPALRDEILQGSSLSAALAQHPASFPPLYSSMIRAGEASGALSEILTRLVEHYERVQEVKEKIIGALVYPAIVIVMGLGVLIFAVTYVIPKFKPILDELGGTLPFSTRLLLGLSKWAVSYGWIAIATLVALVTMATRAAKTHKGQLWWHGLLLKLPLIKGIIASGIYSNFARTLSTLLTNGVPVLQALGIVEKTVGNAVIAAEIRTARNRVTDGTTISGPLASGKVFPKMMTDMLAVGEQTGNVTGALSHIAHRYEQLLNRNIKIFTTALEPIMIFMIATLVGFVAVAILSAVFNLTSGLNAPVP